MVDSLRESAYKVVRSVASPLRFFALASGLLASIIVVLAWKSTLPPELTAQLITVAFVALILILLLVAVLVVFWPKKLTFDQEAHLAVLREKLGDSELATGYVIGALPVVPAPKGSGQLPGGH